MPTPSTTSPGAIGQASGSASSQNACARSSTRRFKAAGTPRIPSASQSVLHDLRAPSFVRSSRSRVAPMVSPTDATNASMSARSAPPASSQRERAGRSRSSQRTSHCGTAQPSGPTGSSTQRGVAASVGRWLRLSRQPDASSTSSPASGRRDTDSSPPSPSGTTRASALPPSRSPASVELGSAHAEDPLATSHSHGKQVTPHAIMRPDLFRADTCNPLCVECSPNSVPRCC